jgi:predicted PurR-regulated permease PerM
MNIQKGFLISVILVLLFIAAELFRPFLGYLLGTVMLAFVLYPLQRRMAPRIGPRISAGILIIFTLLAAVIPFALAVNAVIDDARDLTDDFNQTELFDTEELESMILEMTGREMDIDTEVDQLLNRFVTNTLGSVSTVLDIVTNLSIGLSLSIFVLFYLLKDGKNFKSWLMETAPMPDDIQHELYNKTYRTTWAVVKGHVLVAIAQGSIAGLGLLVVGIDSYAFWTFIMILLAFIPMVGAFLVWGPAGTYLLMTGRPYAGVFLLIWGAVVVGFTDNFLRPLLVDRRTELHPAVILVGVIGGLYVFGAAGIFMGPISLGVLKSVLEVFRNSYEDL